jgi:hypothetical protein
MEQNLDYSFISHTVEGLVPLVAMGSTEESARAFWLEIGKCGVVLGSATQIYIRAELTADLLA